MTVGAFCYGYSGRMKAFCVLFLVGCCLLVTPIAANAWPVHVWQPKGTVKGTVMLIHGGSWVMTGPRFTRQMNDDAWWLTREGYRTINVDYRPGRQAWLDVLKDVDMVGAEHLCLYGDSAGGHIALMIAHLRPQLRCVIARSAPTDLTHLFVDNGHSVSLRADDVFGIDNQAWYSPALFEQWSATTRFLLTATFCDQTVPAVQAERMFQQLQRVDAHVQLRQWFCAVDGQHLVHTTVSNSIMGQQRQAELQTIQAGFANGNR